MFVNANNCGLTVGEGLTLVEGSYETGYFMVVAITSATLTVSINNLSEILKKDTNIVKGKTKKPYYRIKERW